MAPPGLLGQPNGRAPGFGLTLRPCPKLREGWLDQTRVQASGRRGGVKGGWRLYQASGRQRRGGGFPQMIRSSPVGGVLAGGGETGGANEQVTAVKLSACTNLKNRG